MPTVKSTTGFVIMSILKQKYTKPTKERIYSLAIQYMD